MVIYGFYFVFINFNSNFNSKFINSIFKNKQFQIWNWNWKLINSKPEWN